MGMRMKKKRRVDGADVLKMMKEMKRHLWGEFI
jgi:hypothetical protein